jgi:hypothetical protein
MGALAVKGFIGKLSAKDSRDPDQLIPPYAMRPRTCSTSRDPNSVSNASKGTIPPKARLGRLSQRIAISSSPRYCLAKATTRASPYKTIRLVSGKATFPAATLETARRQIQTACQFFEGKVSGSHQSADNRLRQALTNRFLKLSGGGDRLREDPWPARLANDGLDFVDHLALTLMAPSAAPAVAASLSGLPSRRRK